MRIKPTQSIALGAIFVMMCVLKLWMSIFIFFILGVVLTTLTRRKSFCAGFCPMGALQDLTSTKDPRRFLKLPEKIRTIVFIAFWGVIVWPVISNPGAPDLIWWSLLRVALLIAALSLLLQIFYANRTWCTSLCPMGSTYTMIVKQRKNNS